MNKIFVTLFALLFACLILGAESIRINKISHFENDFKNKMNHKISKFLDFLTESVT